MVIRSIIWIYLIVTASHKSYAQTLNELISLAIQNSTRVAISSKEADIKNIEIHDTKTQFLPIILASYTGGERKNTIGNIDRTFDENTRTVSFEQPLFNGLSSFANVKEAKHNLDASKKELKHIQNEIALQVADNYLKMYYNEKMISLYQKISSKISTAEELAQESLSLQDIEYSKYAEISIKKNEIELKINDTSSKLEESKAELQIVTGVNAIYHLQQPMIPKLDMLNQLQEQSQTDNPQLQAQKLNIKAKKANITSKIGQFMPKVSLHLQHERQDSSQFFNGRSVTNNVIYLNIHAPLFQQGAEYTALSKARQEKKLAHLKEKLAMEKVQSQLQTAYHKYHAVFKNITALKKIILSSQKIFTLSQEKLLNRDISKIDVIMQEVNILTMQIKKLELELEMYLSYFLIQKIINNIIQ